MAIPCGERSGSVASSLSRLYIMILLWPPMRRCFLEPWAESGMVINVTWASVRALEAFLKIKLESASCPPITKIRKSEIRNHLHPSPHVDITTGDLGCSKENVSTISAGTIDSHGVLAGMSSCGVESDLPSLAAIGRVCRPCCLIPATLEALGDLGQRGRYESESEESDLVEHDYDFLETESMGNKGLSEEGTGKTKVFIPPSPKSFLTRSDQHMHLHIDCSTGNGSEWQLWCLIPRPAGMAAPVGVENFSREPKCGG